MTDDMQPGGQSRQDLPQDIGAEAVVGLLGLAGGAGKFAYEYWHAKRTAFDPKHPLIARVLDWAMKDEGGNACHELEIELLNAGAHAVYLRQLMIDAKKREERGFQLINDPLPLDPGFMDGGKPKKVVRRIEPEKSVRITAKLQAINKSDAKSGVLTLSYTVLGIEDGTVSDPIPFTLPV